MTADWSIQTPTSAPGAVAVVHLRAPGAASLEEALARLQIRPVAVGQVRLRDLCGVDRGLVARFTPDTAHLFPHGGPAVQRALARALEAAGLSRAAPDPERDYPEARTPLQARMLDALARAASPLAIDLLLDQPRRWEGAPDRPPDDRDRILSRLIDPPLVAALGPPNVGKSTLVNALAGRAVALVADQPGTTRDHVGIILDLAGLVVRYVDTPGRRAAADPIEAEALAIARQVIDAADLLLLCGDAESPPPDSPSVAPALRIALRVDLGAPAWPHDVAVCAPEGRGLRDLVTALRDRLVPPALLADPAPWRFWA